MAIEWVGKWPGGRIARRKDGTRVFRIERQINRRRFAIALDVTHDWQAMKELDDFEKDPVGYLRKRSQGRLAGVTIDVPHVAMFLDHMQRQNLSLPYRKNVHAYLGEWMVALGGRPLVEISTAELAAQLRKWGTAARHRTIALKAYTAFLREVMHTLAIADDPSIALKVPQAQPEKNVRTKFHEMGHVQLIYRFIDEQDVRDVLCLRALTGMHEREASRIAERLAEIRPLETGTEIAGVIHFPHKNGAIHPQSVPAPALAAAQRLAERGRPIDNKRQIREIAFAAERAGRVMGYEIPIIQSGWLRHSS